MDQPPSATGTGHRNPSFSVRSPRPLLINWPNLPPRWSRSSPTSPEESLCCDYCNDVTMLSSTPAAHQAALSLLDCKYSDLGLQIRPDKHVLYIFDGKKTHNRTCFNLQQGPTRNITSAPIKFLGQTFGSKHPTTKFLPPRRSLRKCTEPL